MKTPLTLAPPIRPGLPPGLLICLPICLLICLLIGLQTLGCRSDTSPRPRSPEPRAVTARGDLSAAEQSQIQVFESASPSVVFITNVVHRRDPFSLDVRAGVMEDAAKYGMKIVIDDKLPRDLSDMAATLTKVKALKPDLLVISGHSKGAVTAGRQINEMRIKATNGELDTQLAFKRDENGTWGASGTYQSKELTQSLETQQPVLSAIGVSYKLQDLLKAGNL